MKHQPGSNKSRSTRTTVCLGLLAVLLVYELVLYIALRPYFKNETRTLPAYRSEEDVFAEETSNLVAEALRIIGTGQVQERLDDGQQLRLGQIRVRLILGNPKFKRRAAEIRKNSVWGENFGIMFTGGGRDMLANAFVSVRVIREVGCEHASHAAWAGPACAPCALGGGYVHVSCTTVAWYALSSHVHHCMGACMASHVHH